MTSYGKIKNEAEKTVLLGGFSLSVKRPVEVTAVSGRLICIMAVPVW